jgi:hypothetical protein
MIKLFKYIEPLWLGKNGKISIRRVLALAFSIDLIRNLSQVISNWEVGKSYADIAMLLGLEAGLIAALLALTTYSQNISQSSISKQNFSQGSD